MVLNITEATKTAGISLIDQPVGKVSVNYLLTLMLLQSITADRSNEIQIAAAKDKRAAVFMQSLIEEMKSRGGFSLDTADSHMAFLKQINEKYGAGNLSYGEELVLKQMNDMFIKLVSFKSEMEKIQKDIEKLQKEVNKLEGDVSKYQKELNGYTKKFKEGGFIIPGYNAYLAAKILEYKGKRDGAQESLTLKRAEINSVKGPELEALKANAQRIQKGFEGDKSSEATKMALTSNNEIEQAKAMLDAAMSSSTFLK